MTDPAATSKRRGHVSVVASLTFANSVLIVSGLVTGPIVARALGAEGRGELAAIVAVLTLAPLVLDLGLPSWLARERARGKSRAELLGAALPLAALGSIIGMASALPLSHVLGNDRPAVEAFIRVGLLMAPLLVIPATLAGLAMGDSRWGLVSATRIMASALPLVAIVLLTVSRRLTVETAAAAYLVSLILAGLPLLRVCRGMQALVFSARRTWNALIFAAKSWLIAIALGSNQRLDQVLMAALVPSKELGLYAVAVTITQLSYGLIGAVAHGLFPTVAAGGDRRLVPRSCRITLCIVAAMALVFLLAAPFMVPFVFGSPFASAVPMVTILLAASVPRAVSLMLDSAFTAIGDPGAALRAELIGFAITVPALVLFLSSTGGRGAAVISFCAYSVQLAFQLRMAQRRFDARWWEFVVPTREDFAWFSGQVAKAWRRRQANRGEAVRGPDIR